MLGPTRRTHSLAVKAAVVATAILLPFGCTQEEVTKPGAGPCIHEYREPALTIDKITNSVDGSRIERVSIRQLEINGVEIPSLHHLADSALGMSLAGDTLICTPPCGFGNVTGEYKFVMSADEFVPATILSQAEYSIFEGG